MVSSMAGRMSVRFLCRTPTNLSQKVSSFAGSISNSTPTTLRAPITHSSPLRFLRRELSSFKPLHSATASAYLVSKLPFDATTPNQGRFANYISPI